MEGKTMHNAQSKFIVIDGGEGSGKGTICEHLKKIYAEKDVHFTREPGGTPLSEKLRTIIKNDPMETMTELLLFEAARAEHMGQVIVPALNRGLHVISDRFDSSTYAYQVHARWRDKYSDLFYYVNDAVVTRPPDLYIFCDVRPALALARRMAAGEIDRFDLEEADFHERVYLGYKQFFANLKQGSRWVSVDTSQSQEIMLKTVEDILNREFGF
jgi:dTMP kinase